MFDRFKTILLVTAISLVVWLFAESESVRSRERRLTIELPSDPATGLVMQFADAGTTRDQMQVSVTVTGSAASLAAFEAGSARAIKLTPDMEEMPGSSSDGEIDFRRVLRQHPLFADRGLAIVRADPPTARVSIDRIIELPRQLRVSVEGLTVETDGAPVVTPATVRISGPESILSRLPNDAAVIARPDPIAQAGLVPGRQDKLSGVPLSLPREILGMDNQFVRLSPPVVEIALTVRNKRSSLTINSVPVWIMVPGLVAANWDISAEQTFFSNVEATGSSEYIEQLRRGELRVYAAVTLTADELEKGVVSKEAVFTTLPATPLAFKSESSIVKLTISRRTPPERKPAN